jgi:menaquinone-9 beta-reductase
VTQLELALDTGISARHLSFVEAGRSQPGRDMLLRVLKQLKVPLREQQNQLLIAAGHAPAYPERSFDDPDLAPVRDALDLILSGHEPYPAVAVDRAWNMVSANSAMLGLAEGVEIDPGLLEPPINIIRIGLHPRGLCPLFINLGDWHAHWLKQLERQLIATGDEQLAALIEEVAGYPVPAPNGRFRGRRRGDARPGQGACSRRRRAGVLRHVRELRHAVRGDDLRAGGRAPLSGRSEDGRKAARPQARRLERMSESLDVIVVGARCAGAPLATMLARDGLRVCLIDKDRFPSDTLSTHGIQPTGVQVLERIGVLDSLVKLAPPIRHLRMVFDDVAAPAADLVAVTGAPALSVRRITLDEILLDAAAGAGAEIRTETAVTGLVMSGDRVTGVTTSSGELRAPLVVGADGVRSAVAKMVGAEEYNGTPTGRVFMWAYFEADPTDGEMWIGKLGDHTYLGMPTDGGLTLVGVCPSIERRDEVRADRESVYEAGLRAWPELHEGVTEARRDGPVRTMANLRGFFRASAGPGWALVGDAGHFKDPTPGQGIADALRQSERLAVAITRALGGGCGDPDEILREWWRWRDEDAREMYWFAHDMGAAGPTPPIRREAQRRIVEDPELTTAMVRVLNHELRPSEAFTPAFSLTTLAQALGHRRGQRRAIMRDVGATAADEFRRWRTTRRTMGSISGRDPARPGRP